MKKTHLILFLLFLCSFNVYSEETQSKFRILIESGGVWQNRNDTQIPPDSGTRFDIDRFSEGPFFHRRLEAYYNLNQKHALRLVYAPSTIKVSGSVNQDVTFNGETFLASQELNIKYQFNSYRLSYIYAFKGFGRDQLNLGITAKIREASTTFSQTGLSSTYDNVGFVPLIYFEYQKFMNEKWSLNFTADALGASQGRAVDLAIKLRRELNKNSSIGLGFRSLEGGADNEKVYTFSWFNYAILELVLHY